MQNNQIFGSADKGKADELERDREADLRTVENLKNAMHTDSVDEVENEIVNSNDGLKWWQSGVVYQVYPRSFSDSNGDGVGDIRGIINKLDYIKDLGASIIWLSPVYKSPNDDNGYDISDYYSINEEFGTMADMDELIQKCKSLNIRVIMDLVINHTSDEHEWFKKALKGEKKYRDYYIFRDGKGKNKTKPPNNWTSFFTGSAWERDEESGQFYLHLFSKKQPDLNYENEEVYNEIVKIMRFWLDKGIGGFRCDVINLIGKRDFFDGKKKGGITGQDKFISAPKTHEILRRLRADVLDKYDCFTVGETVFVDTKMANDLCSARRKELDMVFGFEHMETDQIFHKWFKTRFKPKKFMEAIEKWQREVEWNANYFENHDQPRSISRFLRTSDPNNGKALAVLLLSLKGTPYIFEGQEIGMTNGDFKDLSQLQDIESFRVNEIAKKRLFPKFIRWKMIRKSTRDNARTPMQWDDTRNGGFTSGTAWLRVNSNASKINVKNQLADPNSLLNFYKKLIALRAESEVLLKGEFKLKRSDNRVTVFSRSLDGVEITVACNFSSKAQRVDLPQGDVLISTNPLAFGKVNLLEKYGACLVLRTIEASD